MTLDRSASRAPVPDTAQAGYGYLERSRAVDIERNSIPSISCISTATLRDGQAEIDADASHKIALWTG